MHVTKITVCSRRGSNNQPGRRVLEMTEHQPGSPWFEGGAAYEAYMDSREEGAAMSKDLSLADKAVGHLLVRIRHDPRLAYYFDPLTQSMGMLTAAHADALGLDVEQFRKEYYALLSYEAPAKNGTHQAPGE